jgi:hypothetical protein
LISGVDIGKEVSSEGCILVTVALRISSSSILVFIDECLGELIISSVLEYDEIFLSLFIDNNDEELE